MKIITTLPNDYSEASAKVFNEGINHLRKLGHNLTVGTSIKPGNKSAEKVHNQIQKAIKNADILITEVSNPDSKVGYEVANALSEKKIVIALSAENSKNNGFEYIGGSNNKSLIIKNYTSKNITAVLDSALEEAKRKMDTKFILIISPEIDRYLDWAGNTKRMHKAQIVRNSIENMMKKDKDYKNYLEE